MNFELYNDHVIVCVCVYLAAHAGSIAGGIIGALLAVGVVLAVLYYIFRVKGVKLSSVSLPSSSKNHVSVVSYVRYIFLNAATSRFGHYNNRAAARSQ